MASPAERSFPDLDYQCRIWKLEDGFKWSIYGEAGHQTPSGQTDHYWEKKTLTLDQTISEIHKVSLDVKRDVMAWLETKK